MENEKRNPGRRDIHRRFCQWSLNAMTGEEAFDILYGEEEYPEDMKKEFIELYDMMKASLMKAAEEKRSFLYRWKEYVGEEAGFCLAAAGCHGVCFMKGSNAGSFQPRGENRPGQRPGFF